VCRRILDVEVNWPHVVQFVYVDWAGLFLKTTDWGNGATLHRMLADWNDTDTWSTWTNGIQANAVEAVADKDVCTYKVKAGRTAIDVTASLRCWLEQADPNTANKGWAFLSSGDNGWDFASSEGGDDVRPMLMVWFSCVRGLP